MVINIGEDDWKMEIRYMIEVQKRTKNLKTELGLVFFIILAFFQKC